MQSKDKFQVQTLILKGTDAQNLTIENLKTIVRTNMLIEYR